MLKSLFKRRLGLVMAFALVAALVLPAAALAEDTSKPRQYSSRTQTVICTTTTTNAAGETITEDCSAEGSGDTFTTSKMEKPFQDPDFPAYDAGSVTPDTMDTWLNGMMKDLFWTE